MWLGRMKQRESLVLFFFLQGFAGAIAKHCTLHKTLSSRKGFACQFFPPFVEEAIRLDCDDD